MKRTMSMFGAVAALAVGFLFAAPAANAQNQKFGGITCTDYHIFNPAQSRVYPNTGHYFVCSTNTFKPTVNKAGVVFGAVHGIRPFGVTTLSSRGVNYYLFKNRTDANTFMGAKHPGGPFTSNTTQCGLTGVQGGVIEVSLYNTCSYTTTATSNNDLNKTSLHESGHAFDYALGLAHAIQPSGSKAFTGLSSGDHTVLTPQGSPNPSLNWATMTVKQRAAYVCQLFSNLTPSKLEAALGANPAGFVGQVCTNGTSTGLKSQYVGLTPTQIADKKMPYFVNAPGGTSIMWQDVWAEEFSFLNGQQGVGAAILQFTDHAMTAGVSPNAAFHCTRFVIDTWLQTGNPPMPTQLQQQGCFGYQQTDFYHQ